MPHTEHYIMPSIRDEYDDDDGYQSAPRLSVMPLRPTTVMTETPTLPPLPDWKDDIDAELDPLSPAHIHAAPVTEELASYVADEMSDTSEESDEQELATLNYFVHNGYRYDGDIFQLRPPQERSIASRPERILEHKPPLLSNRQTFNRVYSEGTYNARPSSLRQPRRTSSRFSASSMASEDYLAAMVTSMPSVSSVASEENVNVQVDVPGSSPPPLPVTRPPSVRPLSPRGLCRTIEEVKQNVSLGEGNQNLKGLLQYSAVAVTKMEGDKPDVLGKWEKRVYGREGDELVEDVLMNENLRPRGRGRSYTSFAKGYGRGSGKLARISAELGGKRGSFWRNMLMSR